MPREAAIAAYLVSGAFALLAFVRENVSRRVTWGSGILHTLVGLAALHHGDLALRALSAGAFLAAGFYVRLRTNAKIKRCPAASPSSPPSSSGPAAAT